MLLPWEFFPARTTVIFGSVAQDYNAALWEEGNEYKQATRETPRCTLLNETEWLGNKGTDKIQYRQM